MKPSSAKRRAGKENRLKLTLTQLQPPLFPVHQSIVTRSAAHSITEKKILEANTFVTNATRALDQQKKVSENKTEEVTYLRKTCSSQNSAIISLQRKLDELNLELTETNNSLKNASHSLKKALDRCKLLETRSRTSRKAFLRSQNLKSQLIVSLTSKRAEAEGNKQKYTQLQEELQESHAQFSRLRLLLAEAKTQLQVARIEFAAKEHFYIKNTLYQSSVIQHLSSYEAILLTEIGDIRRRSEILRLRHYRAHERIQHLEVFKTRILRTSTLMDKGVYTPDVRALVRALVILNCPMSNVGAAIACCIRLFVPETKPKLMCQRTVARIVAEGGVAADIQLGFDLQETKGEPDKILRIWDAQDTYTHLCFPAYTTGGDGTTHRNLTYESFTLNVQAPQLYGEENGTVVNVTRSGGVRMAKNHKAATQVAGDEVALKKTLSIYKESPFYQSKNLGKQPLTESMIGEKNVGTISDHAADQILASSMRQKIKDEHVERSLGETYLFNLPTERRISLISEAEKILIEEVGGELIWKELAEKKKAEHRSVMMIGLHRELAGEAYLGLSDEKRRQLKIWVRADCQMHKDLNATKGGVKGMKRIWDSLGTGPVVLMNKDNSAAFELADGDEEDLAATRAVEVSTGGAVKLVSLMGSLLNHKDDKKGQHDAFRNYVKSQDGRTFTFPDVSNTRYSSHLEAAAETISHPDFYVNYMHLVRDSKEKPGLNHLEANVLKGLLDAPTRTELAVLALYQEAVSHSYILNARSPDKNALDQGPYHQKIHTHIKKLINSPQLILTPGSNPKNATLNGLDYWKRPEAIQWIWDHSAELPYLEQVFVGFLVDVLPTWERFSAEFAEDGQIAQLTEEDKKVIFIPNTNDANEGALGSFRQFKFKNPTGSVELFNARFKYSRNGTHKFIDAHLRNKQDQAFLRREARKRLASRPDAKQNLEVTEYRKDDADAKRQKTETRAQKKADRTQFLNILQVVEMECVHGLTVAQMKDQLDKLRLEDNEVPKDSVMKVREDKMRELLAAVARHAARQI